MRRPNSSSNRIGSWRLNLQSSDEELSAKSRAGRRAHHTLSKPCACNASYQKESACWKEEFSLLSESSERHRGQLRIDCLDYRDRGGFRSQSKLAAEGRAPSTERAASDAARCQPAHQPKVSKS